MKKNILIALSVLLFASCTKKATEEKVIVEKVTCSLTSPLNNAKVYNNVEISITVTASKPVGKVEFYFDGTLFGSVIVEPYTLKWTPKDTDPGSHKLTCIAYPVTGENAQSEINIIVELKLGDSFKGGNIFYIDDTKNHGLIGATTDLTINSSYLFYYGPNSTIGSTNIINGKTNTVSMANAVITTTYAGYAFKNGYSLNGYTDWYIPAQEQLKLLKENQSFVGNFSTQSNSASYWSSTELSSTEAFALNFVALMGSTVTKSGSFSYRVRPIREF